MAKTIIIVILVITNLGGAWAAYLYGVKAGAFKALQTAWRTLRGYYNFKDHEIEDFFINYKKVGKLK